MIKIKNKKTCQISRVQGIIIKINKTLGFLEINFRIMYLLSIKQLKTVFNGDKVIVKINCNQGNPILFLEKLINSSLDIFIGKIKKKDNIFFIFPKYPFLKENIICKFSNSDFKNIKDGQWVIAQLISHKLKGNKTFCAKILKCIFENDLLFFAWQYILSYNKLSYESPKMDFNKIYFDNNIFRKDLTNLSFFTIDNSNTKDIDDAIFIQKESNNNISIIIAISDPTAYISINSNFDIIASQRLFTNYLPGFNIPMLPRELSENICSLLPNHKRPVLACKVFIDQDGNISNKIDFFLAWIISKAKLTYDDVSNWLENTGIWIPKTQDIINQINLLYIICKKRILWRKKNALIFKNQFEYKFTFSENQNLLNVLIENKRIAHKMIEEVMIIANISAAKILSHKLGFGIYNTHSGFDKNSIKRISFILKNNNIIINAQEITTLQGFCKLRRILNLLPNGYIDSRIRKYQSLGKISITPKPHFALGLQEYATWTSPIRKYGDMINHRLLKNIIFGNLSNKLNDNIIFKIMKSKRHHYIVKKEIENLLYMKFLQQPQIRNKIFQAEIFDIFHAGMRAKLLENGATVFIPSLFLHHVNQELICDQENGIIYINNKEIYRVSNIILISLVDIEYQKRSIIAKPI